jgi:hypothetical protein
MNWVVMNCTTVPFSLKCILYSIQELLYHVFISRMQTQVIYFYARTI